uniref:Uncharacterized protein n=1 Tax=Oryza sativa subsp. japonica TaxID=39947 RepID=Q9FPC2_ORYSJ|nr:hypothetical protein [Oryza sativa Japonica Group]
MVSKKLRPSNASDGGAAQTGCSTRPPGMAAETFFTAAPRPAIPRRKKYTEGPSTCHRNTKTSSNRKTRDAGSLNYTKPVTRNPLVVLHPVLSDVAAKSAWDPQPLLLMIGPSTSVFGHHGGLVFLRADDWLVGPDALWA